MSKTVSKNTLYGLGGVTMAGLLGFGYYKYRQTRLPTFVLNDNLPSNIDEYFRVSLKAALEAGDLVKKYIYDFDAKNAALQTKSTSADLVTLIDKKSEDLILGYIKKYFPNDGIIAEEEYSAGNNNNEYKIDDDVPTWCIDPIDGTTNFFYGIPNVAICIGLRYKGKSILGIVHCPMINETFYGVYGNGSYRFKDGNISKKILLKTHGNVVSENKDVNQLSNLLVLTEVGYDRSDKISDSFGNRITDLLKKEKVRGVRCLGSCAINMCFVASGKADIFYEGIDAERGPKPWDFTAPEVIVEEAGGYITQTNGKKFDCTQGTIICAASKELNEIFVKRGYTKAI